MGGGGEREYRMWHEKKENKDFFPENWKGNLHNRESIPVQQDSMREDKQSDGIWHSSGSANKRKEETLLSDYRGHDPLCPKVKRIFVSSEDIEPEAEVASFELTAMMSSEHYLKEELE
ncbi:hypothetical protein WISP_128702 [Willisornis vidua]|uniref:Uncharacterized protein n=1 Tax=Willisornis vidua TaxID=1566151 RepID=A0ABQ9CQC8_9PASS|nr:hypothetical protein WISP_128702 [Willisornis vidua]